MKFQFIPYLIPLFISAIIVALLAAYGFKHRIVRGAGAFTVSMLIGILWTVANSLEMAGTDLSTKLFWANIQYIAYGFAPVVWLLMVFQFTGREHWVNKRNIFLMSIIPLITIILVWTDNLYGLVRYNFSLDSSGPFPVIVKNYGIWFWIHCSYSYLLDLSSVGFLMRASWKKNNIYRKQAFYLLTGFSVLLAFNFLYVLGFSPFKRFDISPVSFSITGLIIGWGIFHFRLFDLVPIARATVMEKMASGIIVIDKMKRIMDINPRAREMVGLNTEVGSGKVLSTLSHSLQELVDSSSPNGLTQKEFSFKYNDEIHYYEVYISPISDYRKELVAWVLIVNDITELTKARKQIVQQEQELAVMDERDRMVRDLHDNLGQVLSFSNVQIQAVRQQLKRSNQQLADEYLQRLNGIIKRAHKEIREYVYNVRDSSYYCRDFCALVQEEIAGFIENYNYEIELNIKEGSSINILGTEEKMQLMHIIREALTNVLKYAEADYVNISFDNRDGYLELIIEDDGRGIVSTDQKRGSGISIMNERARLIGGNLKIDSQPGRGTRVIVILPQMDFE